MDQTEQFAGHVVLIKTTGIAIGTTLGGNCVIRWFLY